MHTDPLTAARYPDSTDAPNVSQYIQNAVNDLSDQVVPRFATATARDSAYTAWVAAGNTMASGLVCTVGGQLQVYRGSWQPALETKLRQLASTATGTLAAGSSVNLVATQTIPASLFGTSVPYMIDVDAAIHTTLPSGAGGALNIQFDGVTFYGDEFTNPSTSMTHTFKAHGPFTIADNVTHTITALVTAEGGTITLQGTYGHLSLLARPYVTF